MDLVKNSKINYQLKYSFGELGAGNNRVESPKSIFVDEEMSKIYVTEGRVAPRILVFTCSGYLITCFKHKTMKYPWGIAKNKDNIYVTDTHSDAVFLFKQNERVCDVIKVGQFYGSGDNQFSYPKGIAVCKNGNVYIADEYNHRVQVMDCDLKYIRSISDPIDKLYRPIGLKVTSEEVYVLCRLDRKHLNVFTLTGDRLSCRKVQNENDNSRKCCFFCLDKGDNVLMSDEKKIHIYTSEGEDLPFSLPKELIEETTIQFHGITVLSGMGILLLSTGSRYSVHVLS